jgi:hypothetical protein
VRGCPVREFRGGRSNGISRSQDCTLIGSGCYGGAVPIMLPTLIAVRGGLP